MFFRDCFVLVVLLFVVFPASAQEISGYERDALELQQRIDALSEARDSAYTQARHFMTRFRVHAVSTSKTFGIDVEEVNFIKWGDKGLTYTQVPGANLGAVSFTPYDASFALVENSTNELVLLGKNSVARRFSLPFVPKDIVNEKNDFYILGHDHLYRYTLGGEKMTTIDLHEYLLSGMDHIARKRDSTFLFLGFKAALPVASHDEKISTHRLGLLPYLRITNDTSYVLVTSFNKESQTTLDFSTDKKIAGLYFIDADKQNLLIDQETYISESPIKVERKLIWVRANGEVMEDAELTIPNCYYVAVDKDLFYEDGAVYELLEAPDGAHIFKLHIVEKNQARGYPASVKKCDYHYNDNLLPEK